MGSTYLTKSHLNVYVHSDCTGDRDKADGNLEGIGIGLLKKKGESGIFLLLI
jgi:hypothetical protein